MMFKRNLAVDNIFSCIEVTPVGSQMVSFFELIKITNKKDLPKAKAGAAYPQRILARITSGPKWSVLSCGTLKEVLTTPCATGCGKVQIYLAKTLRKLSLSLHYPPGKLKGTVPPSSGARISRLTQGPLMSSCKHFR